MIKKFIMKLIRGNKDLREYVINGCITEDLILPEQKSEILSGMELNSTISKEYLENKTLVFNNCLFINTRFNNNIVHGDLIFDKPYNCSISNNSFIPNEIDKVELPSFMK